MLSGLKEEGASIGASTDCLDIDSDLDKTPRYAGFACNVVPSMHHQIILKSIRVLLLTNFTLVLLGTTSRLLLSLTVKPRLHYMRLYHIPWGTLAQEIVTSIMRLLTWEHARRSVQHGRPLVQSDGGHHRLCTGMGKSHA